MGDTGVNYTVTVTKSGAGGTEAAAELQKVASAAAATNNATKGTEASTANLTKGYKALSGVLTVAGLQTFPQLTAAVMVTKQSLDAMKASGVQLTASAGLIGASIAGLTAIVLTGAQAWITWKANQQEALSAANAEWQTDNFASRLRDDLEAARREGDITVETFERLSRTLGTISGNQQVRDFFRDMGRGNAGDLMAEQQRGFANTRAQLAFSNPNFMTSKTAQLTQLQSEYNDQMKLYNKLLEDGLITQQQFTAKAMEADTARLNSITQLRKQTTDLQDLIQRSKQLFADGIAGEIVNAFRTGTFEARKFFSELAAQIAQMAISMAVMRSFSFFGLAQGGMVMAARGGMFPRFAANGLAGVQSVSSPTFFPKFNVVAGEAGREMMTVLARPRLMEVGGMQAVVGSAQGNRLAITSADALEGRSGAGGGVAVVRISLQDGLRAELIQDSIKGAQVQVVQDLRADTHISRGVKRLVS